MRIFPTKRTVKRWAIGFGVLIGLLLLLNAFMSWRVNSKFNAMIAAIRAEGAPATIADLKPQPIPAEINAAAHIDAFAPRLDQFAKEQHAWEKTPEGKAYYELQPDQPPSEDQLNAIRAVLDKYADLEAAISAAAACPQYASTADFSLGFHDFIEEELPQLTHIRAAARMVNWRTAVLLAEGRPDAAVERWLEMLRLAKLYESEPTLVAHLVAFAVRYIAVDGIHRALVAGPISPELRDRLDAELARTENVAKMKDILITERAVSVSASIEQTSGEFIQVPRVLVWMFGWVPKRFYLGPFVFYEQLMPIADKPWPALKPMFSPGGAFKAPTGHGVLADLLIPAMESGFVAAHRDTAIIRALRVFNALQRYGATNNREAAGLDDLALPKEATIDPFSGRPLMTRRIDNGWLVYSVGANGIDDGGDFEEQKDCGVGPPRKRDAE